MFECLHTWERNKIALKQVGKHRAEARLHSFIVILPVPSAISLVGNVISQVTQKREEIRHLQSINSN